ncbi:MAG TPA: winged helix-turn-helix domain-containing protein [Nitrososphaeraceae archaeon]|jgi:predicted transcriptional regulator
MQYYYHRNRTDIIESILNIANGNEVRQIEILNKAKITHALFKEYMSFLIQYGLIEYVPPRQETYYKTTAKGLDFLSISNKMKALILPPSDLSPETCIPTIRKRKLYRPHLKTVWCYSIVIVFLHIFQTLYAN